MAKESEVVLNRIERKVARIQIEGTAPLITHRFSEKAKKMMADSQQGATRTKKEPKNPEELYEASLYPMPDGDGFGFPATAFKAAIVGAARYFEGLTMTLLKQSLFVTGEGPDMVVKLTDIDGPYMREDNVRIAQGTADLRYRGMFNKWGATLEITYVPSMLSLESVVNLVDAAGFGGVGEWRPSAPRSSTGSYGTFRVVGAK